MCLYWGAADEYAVVGERCGEDSVLISLPGAVCQTYFLSGGWRLLEIAAIDGQSLRSRHVAGHFLCFSIGESNNAWELCSVEGRPIYWLGPESAERRFGPTISLRFDRGYGCRIDSQL